MWITIICILTIVLLKIIYDNLRKLELPPGPRGFPLVGNIFYVKRLVKETKFHWGAWCKIAEIYGPVVSLKLGLAEPLVIVSGRDAVLDMLSRPEFDGRPDGFMFRLRTRGVRRGVIFTDGDVWSDHRRFALRTLKDFGFGKCTMEEMILTDAISLVDVIEKKALQGPIKDLRRITSVAVLNSLWSLVAGTRYDIATMDSKLVDILNVVNDISRDSDVSGGLLNHFPFLRFAMPGLTGFTKRCERLERIWEFFSAEVKRHRETKIEGELRDLIDVYLAEMEIENRTSMTTFDDAQLIGLLKDFFAAGIETTNNTIGFTLTYLAVRQDVQEKVHREMDQIIGRDILPSSVHKNRLPYLSATISEISRIANIGPTTVPHRALVDTSFRGFKIRKNCMLLANLMSVHMDAEHWKDPNIFRPERFINKEGKYFEDPWLIPFGSGRRRCLGESLARNSLFLFLACLLQRFHFTLAPETQIPSLLGIDGFTVAPPEVDIVVEKRNL